MNFIELGAIPPPLSKVVSHTFSVVRNMLGKNIDRNGSINVIITHNNHTIRYKTVIELPFNVDSCSAGQNDLRIYGTRKFITVHTEKHRWTLT